jgi:hypothetical protein
MHDVTRCADSEGTICRGLARNPCKQGCEQAPLQIIGEHRAYVADKVFLHMLGHS